LNIRLLTEISSAVSSREDKKVAPNAKFLIHIINSTEEMEQQLVLIVTI
jgi:hypothetical protein